MILHHHGHGHMTNEQALAVFIVMSVVLLPGTIAYFIEYFKRKKQTWREFDPLVDIPFWKTGSMWFFLSINAFAIITFLSYYVWTLIK